MKTSGKIHGKIPCCSRILQVPTKLFRAFHFENFFGFDPPKWAYGTALETSQLFQTYKTRGPVEMKPIK